MEEQEQKPSTGRIVHTKLIHEDYCRAGLIIFVHEDGSVNLKTWDKEGRENILLNKTFGEWHWPERV